MAVEAALPSRALPYFLDGFQFPILRAVSADAVCILLANAANSREAVLALNVEWVLVVGHLVWVDELGALGVGAVYPGLLGGAVLGHSLEEQLLSITVDGALNYVSRYGLGTAARRHAVLVGCSLADHVIDAFSTV